MKNIFILLCFLSPTAFTTIYAQSQEPRILNVETVKGGVVAVDMNNTECIQVVDGLVADGVEEVPAKLLAYFEQAVSKEKLEKLGFNDSQCVLVKSSVDLDVENFIYRQMHAQVQRVGTQYKVPIAVNGQLIPSFTARRNQLAGIKPEQIKEVRFLDKPAAQAKYGDQVVFGLIEIVI